MKKIFLLLALCATAVYAAPLIINDAGRGTYIGTKPTQAFAFFGATPVVQQSASTDIVAALIAYGLLPSTSSGLLKGDHVIQTGTANPTAIGTIRLSGSSLLIWSGSNWITK